MTFTATKPDRVETLNGDRPPVGMAFGDVTELGAFGAIPTGRQAGRQRRRPVRTGHRLPPPEAALRTFR